MSGLDRIVEEIQKQAQAESGEIIKKAEAYSAEYMAQAEAEAEKETAEINKKAQADRALYESKVKSGMAFKERNAILKAKQQCIETCLEEAKEKIAGLSDADYFALLGKILMANVQGASGVMKLGKKDLERLPQDFEDNVKRIAEYADGNLEISKEPANIENGFVLVYGDIEENCTIKALFDEKADHLRDVAADVLFGTKNEAEQKEVTEG